MRSIITLKGVLAITLSLFLFACGSNDKTETANKTQAKKSNNILPSKCDKIIKEYDELVTKYIAITRDRIDGKEIDKAEEEKLQKEGEELGKRMMKMGYVGLGGQQCYQEFIDIQMKWSNLAIEMQQEAIKKAMEKME